MAKADARLGTLLMMLLTMVGVAIVGAVDVYYLPSWSVITVNDGCWY